MQHPDRSGIERFLGVVGLPRSGTTLLTALLDAHPAIALYYEPFNASKKSRVPVPSDLRHFCEVMEGHFKIPLSASARTTGFKETSILPESLDWAVRTLENVSREVPTQVIWIHRNPIHCLLSKIEGARTWWGYPDARFDEDSLVGFLRENETRIAVLKDLAERYSGTIVRYESLVADPTTTLSGLMERIGEPFNPAQLDYHAAGSHPEKVMGDPNLIEDPKPVSASRVRKRSEEEATYRELIEAVLDRSEFRSLRLEFDRLRKLPALSDP